MSLWGLARWWRESRQHEAEPDSGYPESDDCSDQVPADLDCPDTQPTSPGALDTLPGRLE